MRLSDQDGGRRLAEELGVPFLGSVPLQPRLAALADAGRPVIVAEPASAAAAALRSIADQVQSRLGQRTVAVPIIEN